MHEYSIVQALLDQCEEHVKNNDAKEVTRLVVKIGVMSGVEPQLLEVAFDTFKENTICHNAEFVMNIQAVKILCNNCNTSSELKVMQYCCPECKSNDIKVLDGEEMFLMQLELA